MAEIKINDLPIITEAEFTANDRFLIVDDGRSRLMTKTVFESWLANNVRGEKGEQGIAGRDGARGIDGRNGTDGANGLNAYQLAVAGGFVGTQAQWELSNKGAKGDRGTDGSNGWTPVFKSVPRGATESVLQLIDWVGGTGTKPTTLGYVSDTGIVSNIINASNIKGFKGDRGDKGDKGDKGDIGETGLQGLQGEQGLSPYDLAVLNGFEGTEEEWLLSLNGSEISLDPTNIITKKIDGLFAPITNPLAMAISIDELPDKNIMTDAEREKLQYLESSRYLGTFLTPEDIPLVGAVAGNYADVDSGLEGVDTQRWIYDVEANKFVLAVSLPANETAESVKQKYEANPNTNAFTDSEKSKLEGLSNETAATIKQKYESNPNTYAFTDADKSGIADTLALVGNINTVLDLINGEIPV